VFKDIENEEDEDFELDRMTADLKSKGAQIIGEKAEQKGNVEPSKPIKKTNDDSKKSDKSASKKASPVSENPEGINEWDVDPTSIASGN
jgi:hypothetical protein